MSAVPVIKAGGTQTSFSFWLSEVFKTHLKPKIQPVSEFKESLLWFPLITHQVVCKVLFIVSACSGLVFLSEERTRWDWGSTSCWSLKGTSLQRGRVERSGGRVKAAGRWGSVEQTYGLCISSCRIQRFLGRETNYLSPQTPLGQLTFVSCWAAQAPASTGRLGRMSDYTYSFGHFAHPCFNIRHPLEFFWIHKHHSASADSCRRGHPEILYLRSNRKQLRGYFHILSTSVVMSHSFKVWADTEWDCVESAEEQCAIWKRVGKLEV